MEASYSYPLASQAPATDRGLFLQRTYVHTAGAVLAFGLLCAVLVNVFGEALMQFAMTGWGWAIVLGAFMGASWLADSWARSDNSIGMQYVGLSIYVFAQAVIFTPMLYIAAFKLHEPGLITQAGFMTLFLLAGITAFAFITRKNFSWLGGVLTVGGFIAMGFIFASMLFGFSLGLVFSAAMMLFACGSILYTTSNMIHEYRTDQYVAASLALFSGIALLFYYVLMILLKSRN